MTTDPFPNGLQLGAPGSVARMLTDGSAQGAAVLAMARDSMLGGRWAVFEYVDGGIALRAVQSTEELARHYATTGRHVVVDLQGYL